MSSNPEDHPRFQQSLECPTCKRTTRPYHVDTIEAHDTAKPAIPRRFVLICAYSNCRTPWYKVDDADTT